MNPTTVTIRQQWFLSVDEGRWLELVAEDEAASVPYPLATILASEEDEAPLFEIYTEKGPVRVPLAQVQAAFDAARGEVHSERWFEENVYPSLGEFGT